MSPAPAPALPLRVIASHVVVPLLIGAVMALCYLGGFHAPQPHDVRVDVVGSGARNAVVAEKLQQGLGDRMNIRTADSVDSARNALEHRDVAAAYVPAASAHDPATLYVASAASDTTATIVERVFGKPAIAGDQPPRVVDVTPSDPHRDPSGQSVFFLLVALTVGAYGTGIAIAVAGATRSVWVRLGLALIASTLTAGVVSAIAVWGLDAVPGAQWAIFGLSIPYALAAMLFAIGLHPMIGRFTTLAMVTVFVGLNFTTCGGVLAPEMQPRFFAVLHDFWIGSGFNEAARDIAYFPQVSIAGDVGTIFGWLIAGLALVTVAATVERRRARPPLAASAASASASQGSQGSASQAIGRHELPDLTAEQSEELEEEEVIA